MRNKLGLVIGMGMILAAFSLAIRQPEENRPSPQIAAVETALHATPLPPTPASLNTPPLIEMPGLTSALPLYGPPTPTARDILDILSLSPQDGTQIVPDPKRLIVRSAHPYYLGQDEIVVAGDRAVAISHSRSRLAAFGAVLLWDRGSYRVKFEQIQVWRMDAQVTVSIVPESGEIDFFFRDIGSNLGLAPSPLIYPVQCFVDICQVMNRPSKP